MDKESRLRPAVVRYPQSREWVHGYGYKHMYNQTDNPLHFNTDYPYSKQHSRTPDWIGARFIRIGGKVPRNNKLKLLYEEDLPKPYRVIGNGNLFPVNEDLYHEDSRYETNRINVFLDNGIVTSVAYH